MRGAKLKSVACPFSLDTTHKPARDPRDVLYDLMDHSLYRSRPRALNSSFALCLSDGQVAIILIGRCIERFTITSGLKYGCWCQRSLWEDGKRIRFLPRLGAELSALVKHKYAGAIVPFLEV